VFVQSLGGNDEVVPRNVGKKEAQFLGFEPDCRKALSILEKRAYLTWAEETPVLEKATTLWDAEGGKSPTPRGGGKGSYRPGVRDLTCVC